MLSKSLKHEKNKPLKKLHGGRENAAIFLRKPNFFFFFKFKFVTFVLVATGTSALTDTVDDRTGGASNIGTYARSFPPDFSS